ncbi:MAG TPA: hypothetical protein VM939_05755 [Gemmatimonadaceae bacterium]|nr:hypothetical protein [Gemmatimonadaceae bacterium]
MIRNDQECRRFRKWLVRGKKSRVDMPVRTDERKISRLIVNRTRGAANGRVGIEVPVFVELQWFSAAAVPAGRIRSQTEVLSSGKAGSNK